MTPACVSAAVNHNRWEPPINKWRLLYRFPFLLLHLTVGLPFALLGFLPLLRDINISGKTLQEIAHRWWSRTSCRIFGLKIKVDGQFVEGPALIAANHISWIDIPLLHSISPMGFVAKAEIERWPLAGFLARVGDTVFHRRGSHDSASQVIMVMNKRLHSGHKVAIFAEGGILPGSGIKRFHARLFAAAIESDKPVHPVSLRYLRQGQHHEGIVFGAGETFVGNFFRLLSQPPVKPRAAAG